MIISPHKGCSELSLVKRDDMESRECLSIPASSPSEGMTAKVMKVNSSIKHYFIEKENMFNLEDHHQPTEYY